jgi:polygalacturonase
MYINVIESGVKSNGVFDNTEIVQKLIDSLQPNGGTIYFPSGIYSLGSIELRSNTTIYLESGAVISAVGDYEKYPVIGEDLIPGFVRGTRRGIFFAVGVENICIKGEGTIDGNGNNWWGKGESDTKRPRTIQFINCCNVNIKDINIKNSPCWTINPICCNNVCIDNVSINNPYDAPNTDGINPESCKDVRISNCYVNVGDDCVTLKSGLEHDILQKQKACENISITNCIFAHGHGGVVIGSEMSGGVKNVTVSNCVFQNTDRGIRVKTRRKRGGVVEDIVVNNIIMDNVMAAITTNGYYLCGADADNNELFSEEPAEITEETPIIRNLILSNIIMKNVKGAGIYFYGLSEMPVSNVKISNVDIGMTLDGEKHWSVMAPNNRYSEGEGIYLKNVKDVIISDVCIKTTAEEYIVENVENTYINNVRVG